MGSSNYDNIPQLQDFWAYFQSLNNFSNDSNESLNSWSSVDTYFHLQMAVENCFISNPASNAACSFSISIFRLYSSVRNSHRCLWLSTSHPLQTRSWSRACHFVSKVISYANRTGLATNSIFFCFLFVKNLWCLVRKILFFSFSAQQLPHLHLGPFKEFLSWHGVQIAM